MIKCHTIPGGRGGSSVSFETRWGCPFFPSLGGGSCLYPRNTSPGRSLGEVELLRFSAPVRVLVSSVGLDRYRVR